MELDFIDQMFLTLKAFSMRPGPELFSRPELGDVLDILEHVEEYANTTCSTAEIAANSPRYRYVHRASGNYAVIKSCPRSSAKI